MRTHYLTLTIDTDPDGLNQYQPDRGNLAWDGLHYAMDSFHRTLPHIPLTWYVRADGQLEHAYGSTRYLLETYADFWKESISRGDELGWHPHLYALRDDGEPPTIITDEENAIAELKRIHATLADVPFALPTFRMGEAWHTAQTLDTLETLGFTVDSTAIPGRDDRKNGHPRNWQGAPNQPYFPAKDDPRRAGEPRPLLEIPMNSWYFKAPYDTAPRLRYMNPCIHADLWQQALDYWQAKVSDTTGEFFVWNLILHPAEAMPKAGGDQLYGHNLDVMQRNLVAFTARISALQETYEWTTVSKAADIWRASQNA